jgi:hypothetical protein
MSFEKAKANFRDSADYGGVSQNPALRNISTGLLNLTEALETEVVRIHKDLEALRQQIQRVDTKLL